MKTPAIAALAALLLVPLAGSLALAKDEPVETTLAPGIAPVFIDSTDILYLESFPVQVHLVVRGSLPSPCHEAAFEIQDLGDRIDVLIWSHVDPEVLCAQVLEPFELSVPLGSYMSADIPVVVNGESIGAIEIGAPPSVLDAPTLVGSGWSFGFCLGYCHADLVIEGDVLTLSGRDRGGQAPLYTNSGTLTPAGRDTLDAALAGLAGVALDPIHGCPDCADGGAAYITLADGGVTTKIQMEFANPPDVLADAYAVSAALMSALEACGASDLVTVAEDCEPYER